MRNLNKQTIESSLREAGKELFNSFSLADPDFWPAAGNHDMAERHLTYHLATALRKIGFVPYFEVSGNRRRADLVLVRWEGNKAVEAILVEAKLLYSNDRHAKSVASYVRRLDEWHAIGNQGCLKHASLTRMILVSVWCGRARKSDSERKKRLLEKREALVSWWRKGGPLPALLREPGFQDLHRIRSSRVKRRAMWIPPCKAAECEAEASQQYLLAVAWR